MGKVRVFLAVLILGLTAGVAAGGELSSDEEKLSYALGMEIGSSLKALKTGINPDVFSQGVKDILNDGATLLTPEEAEKVKKGFFEEHQKKLAKEMEALGEKNIKEQEKFLAENKAKEGVITTASGLQYMVLAEGDGPKPAATDSVKVNYRGTLIDGTEFDSSYKRGTPAVFPANRVIPGWTEALQLMKVGSKYRLFIPSEIAYGKRAASPVIGPNSMLIFEVELLGIENAEDKK